MKRTTALALITTVAMALGTAAVSAQPYGYRHYHHYYYGGPGLGYRGGSTREGMVRTPGN
jgi:hypothetical protein